MTYPPYVPSLGNSFLNQNFIQKALHVKILGKAFTEAVLTDFATLNQMLGSLPLPVYYMK